MDPQARPLQRNRRKPEVDPACPTYYQREIQRARDLGLVGVVPRIDDGFSTNQGTAREFNLFVCNHLIGDPDTDIDPLWDAFFKPYYGDAKVAAIAIEGYKRTFDMTCANS
tara:strand:- start:1547 stop:1879 length:333 start_codon:yes stop_codon:yes gene_type:complete